jgi:NADH dehydrogenase [ubiquinone] 1 alpha subcomplex assembly factor 1
MRICSMQVAKVILFCTSILFLVSSIAHAHRPVIVKNQSSKEKPVLVKEPEISYAYYGELVGEPHYYKIVYPKEFILYVNVLVPDFSPKTEPIPKHDMSFQISADAQPLFTAEGNESEWQRFYERYGRDHYYMGPEFEQGVPAGTYLIKVFSGNNKGKYALAIGKKENFTPWGLVGAMLKARSLDKWFFKPSAGGGSMEVVKKTLIDFSRPDEKENWRIVNDVVMGGISQSEIIMTDDSTAIFQGILSLENNGGFASARTNSSDYKLAGYDGIIVRIKGDGRTYQLRLRTDDRFDGISYRSEFQTTADKWINVKLPFSEFVATFHGQRVPDAPVLDPGRIRQIGFLIADKKAGPLKLEIDWIGAYMEEAAENVESKGKMALSDYLWKNRLLLIFSPSELHPDYKAQKKELEEQMAEVEDRDLVVFEIFEKGEDRIIGSPVTYTAGESLRERFNVKPGQLTVILIGKDGGEKLRSTGHIPFEEVFSLIDSMPMRQAEMRERRKGK